MGVVVGAEAGMGAVIGEVDVGTTGVAGTAVFDGFGGVLGLEGSGAGEGKGGRKLGGIDGGGTGADEVEVLDGGGREVGGRGSGFTAGVVVAGADGKATEAAVA